VAPRQVPSALRGKAADLEAAGICIIQVDEPALRELLSLRHVDGEAYLDSATWAFRTAA
jgi:5-methyltetrahydropteroyltriglutamate--homocysteine methyltransferase